MIRTDAGTAASGFQHRCRRWMRLLPVVGLVTACSTAAPPVAAPEHPQPEHPPVLSATTLEAAHNAQQILRVAFRDRESTLRGVVQVSPAPPSLSVVLLTVTGQRLLSVTFEGTDWKVDKPPFMPESFQPEQVVGDLELALWPLATLKAGYPPGWSVNDVGGGVRRLRHDGQLFEEVHYADGNAASEHWQGRFWISNFRYAYSLAIESTAV